MINIALQISTYIFIALLLGYFFGWLITKSLIKERYQAYLDEFVSNNSVETEETRKIKDEIFQIKRENKRLKEKNKELSSGYMGQKYVLDEHNATLDEFQKRLKSKDEVISVLTAKLSLAEEAQRKIEKKYEEEIDAFMFERIEITQKYKNLLDKFNVLIKQKKGLDSDNTSWFSKFFSSSLINTH